MRKSIFLVVVMALLIALPSQPARADGGYCVVVSKATGDDPQWKPVVAALVEKHHGTVIRYDAAVKDSLAGLKKEMPRYACFVATSAEASREFVAEVNRLTRRLNDDPYGDVLWGIVTGYDAATALRMARHKEPLVIRRAAAGTEVALDMCEEGVWYCELHKGKMVRKLPGKRPEQSQGPADTTHALADALGTAQLFVTSGHATERDWQIGYGYRNGQFRSQAGELFGVDTKGERFAIRAENPKVYLPVGNCLMGHIDGPDAMALAFMRRAGVYQMIGYTVPTWYGYAGWGMLDYFVEQPGRFSLAEAFFANQQALIHRLETYFPGTAKQDGARLAARGEVPPAAKKAGLTWNDAAGLLYDRDTLALYGDPAWDARLAPGPLAWEQKLTEHNGVYEFEIRPLRGKQSFEPVNTNGSQRGGRPIVQLLPHRIDPRRVRILEGDDLKPVVTAGFILIPHPGKDAPDKPLRLVFRGTLASQP